MERYSLVRNKYTFFPLKFILSDINQESMAANHHNQ